MTRFHERMMRLLGTSTWREPVGGVGTAVGRMSSENRVAAAMAYARRHAQDVGPDLAVAMYLHSDYKRDWIVRLVSNAFAEDGSRLVRRHRPILHSLCGGAFDLLVHGRGYALPQTRHLAELEQLFDAIQRVMVSEAEEAVGRAARKEGRAA